MIRSSSFRLASLHQTSLGLKILNVSPCQPLTPNKNCWTKSKDDAIATLGNKNGGQSKISKDANRTPPPPPQKKKKRHFNKYIGPSQTATTYTKVPAFKPPHGRHLTEILSSPAIFCPRVASWFLIDQSNEWDSRRKQTNCHFKRILCFKWKQNSPKLPKKWGIL